MADQTVWGAERRQTLSCTSIHCLSLACRKVWARLPDVTKPLEVLPEKRTGQQNYFGWVAVVSPSCNFCINVLAAVIGAASHARAISCFFGACI